MCRAVHVRACVRAHVLGQSEASIQGAGSGSSSQPSWQRSSSGAWTSGRGRLASPRLRNLCTSTTAQVSPWYPCRVLVLLPVAEALSQGLNRYVTGFTVDLTRMQDIFGLDQRKSKAVRLWATQNSRLTVRFLCCHAGASKWQAFTFQLGVTLIAAGLLAMLFTALRSFGAAELLGQVSGEFANRNHNIVR